MNTRLIPVSQRVTKTLRTSNVAIFSMALEARQHCSLVWFVLSSPHTLCRVNESRVLHLLS